MPTRRPPRAGPWVGAALAATLAGTVAAETVDLTKRLPDGGTARAAGDIAEAWYVGPTGRYAHGVLGDGIEAAGLAVTDRAGKTHVVALPDHAVFEDITPRLADLDGDGRSEVVTIRSTRTGGAALVLYGLSRGRLAEIASIPPIGRGNRWLNPAAIADFDGDGRKDVALVKTPHIGGTLEIWGFDGAGLTLKAARAGFSNHAIGSRALDLAATVDADGDGIADLVLPDAARRSLVAVTLKTGTIAILATEPAPGGVAGGVEARREAGGVAVRYTARDGTSRRVVLDL